MRFATADCKKRQTKRRGTGAGAGDQSRALAIAVVACKSEVTPAVVAMVGRRRAEPAVHGVAGRMGERRVGEVHQKPDFN